MLCLISTIQQSVSYTIYILFHYALSQDTEYSSLCHCGIINQTLMLHLR